MVTLYRHFAADGTLLYAGISATALFRLHQHKKESHWFPEIATITLTHYPDRKTALAAEKVAIQTEGPRHNYHWWAANQKPKTRRWVPHPCKGCGVEIVRRRFWCIDCARERDREAQAAWRTRHPDKQKEYMNRHREKYPNERAERYRLTGC